MWLTLALKNWKYIAIIALVIGFYTTYKVMGAEIKSLNTEVSALREANHSNTETIKNLKTDITKTNSTCSKRLNSKDELIKEIQRIDRINTGENNESGSDPLIDEFIKLYSGN